MRKQRVLDLFTGFGSVANYARKHNYEVVTLDINCNREPTVCVDIRKWKYKQAFPPGYFDIIWASPECKEYSKAKTVGTRDLTYADSLVRQTLRIIAYFKPKAWFIENPQTGLLKTRPFMQGLPYYDVTYCMYGYDYRKPTRIWTNVQGFKPKFCRFDCSRMEHGKHPRVLGHSSRHVQNPYDNREYRRNKTNSIPTRLVGALLRAI